MGGIGKTTLASAVYQRLSYCHFEGRYFVWNVREEYARHGPNHLRKKLLSELLNDEAILRMDTPFVISPFILDRLKRKKVLAVLDDVDNSIHLYALVEGYNQLASGSRIIVTSRNKQVLKKVADDIYKVERLNQNESLELFHLHAFRKNISQAIDDEMVLGVTSYANGNPLALKVLGSFLCSRIEKDWESALKTLKRIPNPEIQDVLRISYEGLDDQGIKDTFLDIACLFNSTFSRDIAVSILDDGNSFVNIEISVLIDKSLIESNEDPVDNLLWMHDLIRQMGRAIVRDEHIQSSNCSRLEPQQSKSEIKENVNLCRGAFSNMHNLQILKIYCCDDISISEFVKVYTDNIAGHEFKLSTPKGLDPYLSDKLRYFQWDFYPLNSLPSKFNPQNLVQLVLRGSRVEKLWNYKVQPLPLLRMIDLSYSKFLTQLPDLPQARKLESINLEGCTSFVQVFSSLQNLDKLTYLNLKAAQNLEISLERHRRVQGTWKLPHWRN
ncbi:disease resistance protein RPV1-like [Ziziphus jujuba]|uniref:Disease resistance protein RPV1-like n=1 Tax=Ziziphus jujuba TaxID=326968 RepID=A0ABM4AB59_ZIZJJ|nr:disease resistance protein RPV1-like [Ziziphus jujuba]